MAVCRPADFGDPVRVGRGQHPSAVIRQNVTQQENRPGAVAAVLWFSLALIGEMARLRLMQAGPLVGYQHYIQVGDLFARAPIATSVVIRPRSS